MRLGIFTCVILCFPTTTLAQSISYNDVYAALPLDAAREKAVINSPDVAAATARVRQNQAALAAVRAAFGPALTSSYTEAPQGGPVGTIAQRLTTVGAQTTLGELITRSPAISQAQANVLAAELALQTAQRSEQVKVIGLYYDALRASATLRARESALRAVEEDRSAAQKRFSAGDAPRLDVVRAQVASARATADLENSRAASDNATEALAVEAGITTGSLASIVPQRQVVVETIAEDPARATQIALANRPEIAAAESNVRAQESAIRVAQRGIVPALTLIAGYTKGVDSGVRVSGPNVSAQLALPIAGAARARIAGERARLDEAQAKLAAEQRRVSLEVSAAVRTFLASGRARTAATRAREQALTQLTAATVGYRNGATSSLEVAAARQTYTQAILDELSAIYAVAQTRATLRLQIGP
ncbi:MAG: TolC family protein [Candidatus Eremiobacteraeota bacterium]|nr:TolC family protein [Candidatus Eremiobacteraeota bacterium]